MSNADSDGLEKIRNTRLMAPLLPIIVLINSDTNDFHQLVTSVGADDFLYKHTLHPELTLRTLRYTIEQKRNIAKRSKIENKFEDLVNLLPQPVFECDLKGNLVFANDLAFKIFGYSKKEFLMCLNV